MRIGSLPYYLQPLTVSPETQRSLGQLIASRPGLSAAVLPAAGAVTGIALPASPAATTAPGAVSLQPPVVGLAKTLTDEDFQAMFKTKPVPVPLPPHWQSLIPPKPAGEMGLELTKAVLDAIPAGTPLPTAVEGVGAVVAGIDLLKRLGDPDAACEEGRLETFLVYSCDVVDIASFLSHVVPGLHALDAPLTVLGIALKSCGTDTVHAFSLTPEYRALAAAGVER